MSQFQIEGTFNLQNTEIIFKSDNNTGDKRGQLSKYLLDPKLCGVRYMLQFQQKYQSPEIMPSIHSF